MRTQPPIGRVYGRRRGRRLKGRKSELLETGLDRLRIALPEAPGSIDPSALFAPAPDSVWLEIGFGGGEHLAAQAALHPEIGFIGCEPFVNGVSNLLVLLDEGGIGNVRIFSEDARLLLERLPEASIGGAFLLFPDPWPKRRHAERRFASAENLTLIARALADHAELRVATDHPVLKQWMPPQVAAHPDFTIEARADSRPAGWPPTRYESKALAAGRESIYLTCRRAMRG
jgi:tRNA (guanine-N7-)-methyltransferase